MSVSIEAQGIYKIYDDLTVPVHAVNGVDLQIEKGEFTAVVGPSGSGKTTLLNIIGGLDYPTKGRVMIDGEEITAMPERKRIEFRMRHIGFVFQAYNLIPVLTARENAEFVMLLQKNSLQERKQRVEELMEKVGIIDRIDNLPSELSGGQQQRVAVVRALAPKPSFVLADEPTANLDSKSTSTLLDIMADLNKEEGTTFIFSTHDQRVIDRARRVITLEDGAIVSDVLQS